jgi:putative phosphoesterase
MRIGVVSDTHNHMPSVRKIVELFRAAGVERVVHTGDITQAKVLEVFASLGVPLHGVFGNNDLERESLAAAARLHGFALADPPLELSWAGRELLIVHDPRDLEAARGAHHELVLHGHTHRRRIERDGRALIFNPGECAGHMVGYNAVGVVDLATLAPELLSF